MDVARSGLWARRVVSCQGNQLRFSVDNDLTGPSCSQVRHPYLVDKHKGNYLHYPLESDLSSAEH